jgi:hypothetical protein
MNWVPSSHTRAVESEGIESPPPATSWDSRQKYSTTQTEPEALVPALPPKPINNNWSVKLIRLYGNASSCVEF